MTASEGGRLDRLLASQLPGVSRRRARFLITEGCVFVDGKRCQIAAREVAAGARLVVHDPEPTTNEETPILFEDEDLVVVNKPFGVQVNETETTARVSVVERLKDRGAITVHRIDRDTSGIVIFAKNKKKAEELSSSFRERTAEKVYLAVACGEIADGLIDAPIGKDRRRPRARAVRADGKPAQTSITTVAVVDRLRAVVARPRTGRTHQIRVHLAHHGAPILGDTLYGAPVSVRLASDHVIRAERMLLHAARLTILSGGKFTTFEAPIPEDFAALEPHGLVFDSVYE